MGAMDTIGASPSFGELLRRYRLAAGLTQEELAEQARLSARAISDHERGVRRAPYRETVRLLAQALQLAPAEQAALVAAARRTGVASAPGPATDAPQTQQAHQTAGRVGQALPPLVPSLVGRARELAALERHLAGHGPPVLLLAGEPGIGKSRLLHEAARRAADGGWTVLQGGCQGRGGQEPYAPMLDALERHVQARPSDLLRRELQGCAWLVRLLPELAGSVDEAPRLGLLPPEQERRLMVRAVARFLANVAGPSGTLLLLDDLQWAGADALALLSALVRSPVPDSPALRVVGAYRDTDVHPQDALAAALADLARAELAVQLTVGPLQPQEAARLLNDLLAGMEEGLTLRERILERADAVPFFLVSCARGLDTGALRAGATDSVPWTLAQSIRQRVVALPEVAQAVLRVAAVIGRRVSRGLLAAAALQPDEAVLAGLEAACRAHILEEEGADGYRFAHDVIREVVEADLGAARRAALHGRVAATLEQHPAGTSAETHTALLAYHYSRSDAQDRAVLYLERAGDHAWARYANAAAEAYYQDASARLDALGRTLDAARVREKLGAALRTAVRYDAALMALEHASEAYRAASDADSLARVMAGVGRIHVARVMSEEGVRRLQPFWDLPEPPEPSHGLAALYAALAHLYFATGRYSEQLAAAERAIRLARLVDDNRLLAEADGRRSLALLMLGRPDEALAVSERVTALAEAAGDLDSLRRALNVGATIYRDRGAFAAARRDIEQALVIAARQGDPAQVASLTSHRGEIAFLAGDWAQAHADCERAVARSREIGVTWAHPYTLLYLGQLHLGTGAWNEAGRCLDELVAMAGYADLRALRQAQGLLAERDLLQSRPASAYARLVPLLDRAGLEEWNVIPLLPRLAWAHLDLGEVQQARRVVAQTIRRAQAGSYHLALVDALRVQALVAQRQERWEEAQRALDMGLGLARSMPYPYAEARLLHAYGEMYAQQHAPDEARARLSVALDILCRLGAHRDAELVTRLIGSMALR